MRGVLVLCVLVLGCVGGRAQRPQAPLEKLELSAGCVSLDCVDHVRTVESETFTSTELGVEIDKPDGNDWAFATDVVTPQGSPIPVVVAHPASGAQIVMQVSEGLDSPEALARMLQAKLSETGELAISVPKKLVLDSAVEAYGFDFAVEGEAHGRVALIQLGDQMVLVVASWPPQAGERVVQQIDAVVRSVRAIGGDTSPAMMRPDKA